MRMKIFLVITVFIGIFIVMFFSSMLYLQKNTIDYLTTTQLENQAKIKLQSFDDFINHRLKMLDALKSNIDFKEYIETGNSSVIVKNLFITQASSHQEVFQFRYIDKEGNEKIRIDNYSEPELVVTHKLQNKKDRYYFKDTMKLNEDEVYFSNIDLNIERGEIEPSHIPTLRIATPIFNEEEHKGILIININMKRFIQNFTNMQLYDMALFYEDGHLIYDRDEKNNWSRDLNLGVKVQDLYTFLPQTFDPNLRLKNGSNFVAVLPLPTKDRVYMVIMPKTFKKFSFLYEYIKDDLYLFLMFTIFGIVLSYFISEYLEKLFKRRMVFERIKNNNILINSVINSTSDLIFYRDADLNYLGCNRLFQEFSEKKEVEILGQSDEELFSPSFAKRLITMGEEVLKHNQIYVKDEWIKHKSGRKVFYQFKNIPFEYQDSDELGVLTIAHDITEFRRLNEKLQEESFKDALTGISNRKAFNEKLEEKLELHRRYGDVFCMAMIDIDNFKQLNDTYGHDCGDRVLIEMSKVINALIRRTDLFFRVGGEEFILIFPKTKLQSAYIILDKVRRVIQNHHFITNSRVTISCGLVEVQPEDMKQTIYKRADTLLYKTKTSGKNGISVDDDFLLFEI